MARSSSLSCVYRAITHHDMTSFPKKPEQNRDLTAPHSKLCSHGRQPIFLGPFFWKAQARAQNFRKGRKRDRYNPTSEPFSLLKFQKQEDQTGTPALHLQHGTCLLWLDRPASAFAKAASTLPFFCVSIQPTSQDISQHSAVKMWRCAFEGWESIKNNNHGT